MSTLTATAMSIDAEPTTRACGHECFQCAREELLRATEKLERLTRTLAAPPPEEDAPLMTLAAPPPEDDAPLMTIIEVADLIGMSKGRLYGAIRSGKLKTSLVKSPRGKAFRISRADALAFNAGRKL